MRRSLPPRPCERQKREHVPPRDDFRLRGARGGVRHVLLAPGGRHASECLVGHPTTTALIIVDYLFME